ncbi:MAG: mannosyltransferase family protein [Cyanobacteria bacterium]|nr:mannosyltransferase family protein [Cyanobacteriota bacterium]
MPFPQPASGLVPTGGPGPTGAGNRGEALLPPLVLGSWLLSRLLFFGPLLIAVQRQAPGSLASRLSQWDAAHYLQIVTEGYSGDNFAFFPFFPYFTRLTASLLQLPPLAVALVLSNGAFLIALGLLYRLSQQCQGNATARSVVLLSCFNPMSIFFAIPYTESLYLLFTCQALLELLRPRLHAPRIAFIGALIAATRPTGLVIAPAILVAFGRQRRLATGLVVALLALGGLGAVAWINLHLSGNPLAFVQAQKAWNVQPGFNLSGLPSWNKLLTQVLFGLANTRAGALIDRVHPLLITASLLVGVAAFRLRHKRPRSSFLLSLLAFLAYWLLAGMPGLNLLLVVGAALLICWGYRRLPLELWIFGAASLALYLLKQNTISLERHIFATAPLLMLYGAWFEQHQQWRRFLLGFGSLLLLLYALRFAQGLWIG